MQKLKFLIILVFACIALVGCKDDLDAQYTKSLDFYKSNRVGYSEDYAVIKFSISGMSEPVIIVQGFVDDFGLCRKIAAVLNEEEPNTYTCMKLN